MFLEELSHLIDQHSEILTEGVAPPETVPEEEAEDEEGDDEEDEEEEEESEEVRMLRIQNERLQDILCEQESAHNERIAELEEQLAVYKKQEEEYEETLKLLQQRCTEWQTYAKNKEEEAVNAARAVESLQMVLEQLQSQQEVAVSDAVRPLKTQLKQFVQENAELKVQVDKLEEDVAAMNELKVQCLKQKQDLDAKSKELNALSAEVEPLKQTLEQYELQLQQFSQEEQDSVDKRVVKKLVLTFVARPSQRKELLELMSRILDFSEQDRVVAGLQRGQGAIPPSPSRKLTDASKKSLGQLWTEFLMSESTASQTPKQ